MNRYKKGWETRRKRLRQLVFLTIHGRSAAIPLTRGKWAFVDMQDLARVAPFSWCAAKHDDRWYAKKAGGYMHRLIAAKPEYAEVDHRDGNGLNNRRENLRPCTPRQNMCNRRSWKTSRTRYRGVTLLPSGNFSASIQCDGKTIYIQSFPTAEQAARAYDDKAREVHGEFARTNFPPEMDHAEPHDTPGQRVIPAPGAGKVEDERADWDRQHDGDRFE